MRKRVVRTRAPHVLVSGQLVLISAEAASAREAEAARLRAAATGAEAKKLLAQAQSLGVIWSSACYEVELTAEEEAAVIAQRDADADADAEREAARQKRTRLESLKADILTALAAGEAPDAAKVEEFRCLRDS